MIKILNQIMKTINISSEFCGNICNVTILLITSFVFYEVVMRYVINRPTIWVSETCQYLLPILCFVGAGYCLKKKGHINVDLVTRHYPIKVKALLDVFIYILSFIFFAVLFWEAFLWWHEAYVLKFTSGTIFDIPLSIPYIVFPVGILFFCFQLFVEILNSLAEFNNSRKVNRWAQSNPD